MTDYFLSLRNEMLGEIKKNFSTNKVDSLIELYQVPFRFQNQHPLKPTPMLLGHLTMQLGILFQIP